MKLARILLASAAVALLAACGTNPVGPSDASDRIKPRHSVTVGSTRTNDPVTGDGSFYRMDETPTCVNAAAVVAGVSSIIQVCDGRGPQTGSGG